MTSYPTVTCMSTVLLVIINYTVWDIITIIGQ